MRSGERVRGRTGGAVDAGERSRPGAAGPARPLAGGTAVRDGLAYWLDVPYTPRAPLEGDVDVDACVIGAGVAGLSCARRLALHGLDTLVLERDTVAGGASGRNGGFLLAGVAAFHNDARERYGGERARRIYGATLAAQEEIYALAAELGAGDVLRRTGLLRLAVSPEEAEHVRGQVDALRADGFPGELVEREELPQSLRRIGLAGCLTEHDGALDPARWVRLLASAAERAGARICERTAVRAPLAAPGEGAVEAAAIAEGGTTTMHISDAAIAKGGAASRAPAASAAHLRVRARHVVAAADGALPILVPEYAGRVRARRLHMVATAPVPPLLERPVYARWGHEYLQQRTDGRLLAGGFSDLDGAASYTDGESGNPRIWERIERYLQDELEAPAEVTHRWTGVVGYSEDLLPFAGEVPGRPALHVAGGYSGHGNVVGFLCGRDLADAIAGRPSEPLFGADR